MEFRILGRLEVDDEPGVVPVNGVKPRAVLAVLLLKANQPVSAERLAVALWGEEASHDSVRKIQVHVSRLRKALPNPDLLTTTPAGYCLRVQPGQLDADRFELLVEEGLRELEEDEPERASDILREALSLWRGPPLADLADEPFAAAEIMRLEERRLFALENRIEADLKAGRHAALVAELQQLFAEHPRRERLAEQLMLALYRSGRQREALEAYRDMRAALVEEGLRPGPRLSELQDAILRQDPALDPPAMPALPTALDIPSGEVFAGRDIELAWLKERWDAVKVGGRGRIVSVIGPRGSGKTRLAAELARSVNRRGFRVFYGAGEEASEAIAEALVAPAPTLLVLDDVKPPDIGTFAAVPVLTLVTGETPGPGRDILNLAPLDRGAVREIARRYAEPADLDDLDDTELLQASGGIAREVHRLAERWARDVAEGRVRQAAGRAEASRAELDLLESQLAGNVAALQAVTARATAEREPDGLVVCPFKGLASFEAADAPYFFGRDQLVADLVARLVGAPLLGVVGDSGSGKSSVVKAGLLPALANGMLPGSHAWQQGVFRPGPEPLRALEAAQARLGDGHFVLVVDQFEETFTACHDRTQRAEFLARLVTLTQRGQVVLTIRADHYARCAENAQLARLLDRHQVLVGPMDEEDLRLAVEGPAMRARLDVEPRLTSALVRDVQAQPGALPLLSAALLELWQHRSGRRLTYLAYENAGGVSGAVARLAEGVFGELAPEQQRVAHEVMMKLVVDTGNGDVERRRVARAELGMDEREDVATVVEALTERRLLTAHEGTVEVAHEALLREWPRLRQWIDERREPLRVERKLREAAADWDAGGRDEEMLWGRVRLAPAEELVRRGLLSLDARERAFLAASGERLARVRRARRRGLTIAFAALAVALVAITAVAVVAMNQRRDADHQRRLAVSRELALESGNLLDSDPELGLRLALWARETAATDQADFALRQAVLGYRQLAELPADAVDANAAATSPDGRHVITGGNDGTARLWDLASRKVIAQLPHKAVLTSARFSPRGDRIALGYDDGSVTLTDDALARPRELLAPADGAAVGHVAFSGDGARLAAALGDGSVRIFDLTPASRSIVLAGHEDAVLGVSLDADGSHVVSSGLDGTVRLWPAVAGAVPATIHSGGEPENAVAFSPDGKLIAGVGGDRRVRLWDATSGKAIRSFDGLGRQLRAVAFSPDSQRLATGGRDGVIRIWSVAGGPDVAELRGQRGRVYDLAFGPREDRVTSAGDDGTVRVWDAGHAHAWPVPGEPTGIKFAPGGKTLATAGNDGVARIYDAGDGSLLRTLPGVAGYTAVDFSPNGDRLLVGYDSASRIRIWPLRPGATGTTVRLGKDAGFNAGRFAPDGKRIVYADENGRIAVRTLATGAEVVLRGGPKDLYVYDLSFSADGRRVAVVAEQVGVLVWRIDRPDRPERDLRGYRGHVNAMAYAADGRIVTSGADRTVRVWSARSDDALVMRGHTDEVGTVLVNPAGDRVLSTSVDGSARVWDARRGVPLAVLQQGQGALFDIGWSGRRVATLDEFGNVKVFDCPVCGSLAEVQAAARALRPRALSPEERRRFLAAAG